jgi:hypothetical protein
VQLNSANAKLQATEAENEQREVMQLLLDEANAKLLDKEAQREVMQVQLDRANAKLQATEADLQLVRVAKDAQRAMLGAALKDLQGQLEDRLHECFSTVQLVDQVDDANNCSSGDGLPQAKNPNSSNASPDHSHATEGSPELVDEPTEQSLQEDDLQEDEATKFARLFEWEVPRDGQQNERKRTESEERHLQKVDAMVGKYFRSAAT